MEKLNVAFTGYANYINVYREILKGIDLSKINTGYYEIMGENRTKYVEGNNWLTVDDFNDFKYIHEFPFEGLLNKDLLIIHPNIEEDILQNFYYSARGGEGIIFYFWRQMETLLNVKEKLKNIATCGGIFPLSTLPKNILFGLLPPSSIEDLLELKEGRVPSRKVS